MSRQLADIDVEQLKKLAMLHCTNVEIGDFFGVDESTIRKRFSDILLKSRTEGKISLRRTQFRLAEKNVAMAIWLGKQILGQKETLEISHEGLIEEELDFIGMPQKKTNKRFDKYYN